MNTDKCNFANIDSRGSIINYIIKRSIQVEIFKNTINNVK